MSRIITWPCINCDPAPETFAIEAFGIGHSRNLISLKEGEGKPLKRNRIKSIQIHYVPDDNPVPVNARFNAFRLRTIERLLGEHDLTASQKKEVLDGVLSQLNHVCPPQSHRA